MTKTTKMVDRFISNLRSISVKSRLQLLYWMMMVLLVLAGAIFLRVMYVSYESYIALEGSHTAATVMDGIDSNITSLMSLTRYPVVQTDQRPNNTYLYLASPDRYSKTILDSDLAYRSTFLFSQNREIRLIAVFDLKGEGSYIRNDKKAVYKATQRQEPINENGLAEQSWFVGTIQQRGKGIIWRHDEIVLPNIYLENTDQMLFVSRAINSLSDFKPLGLILAAVDISQSKHIFEDSRRVSRQQIGVFDQQGRTIYGDLSPQSTSAFLQVMKTELIPTNGTQYLTINGSRVLYQFAAGKNGLYALVMTPTRQIAFQVVQQELWLFMLLFLAAFLVALALNSIVKSIVVPVKHLADTCKLIVSSENFSITIPDGSQDEFAELTKAFNSLTSKIEHLIIDVYEKQMELGQTQIQLLRSQMNPHLLYNTLETIRGKALLANQAELADMAVLLASILRYGISAPGELVLVEDEVQKLHEYLALQKHLYSNRFQENVSIDPAVMKLKTIKFILQPLVENAIIHGFSKMSSPGFVEVLGYVEDGEVVFQVVDNGIGMSGEELSSIKDYLDSKKDTKNSVGLKNVHRRLRLLFGDRYGVTIKSRLGTGTVVSARLPYISGEDIGGEVIVHYTDS